MTRVFWDLKAFLLFYFILLFFIAQMLCVIGLANPNIPGHFRDEYLKLANMTELQKAKASVELPNEEYKVVGV